MAGFGVDRGGGSSSGLSESGLTETIDAKGDLIVGTADNAADRLAVGTNEQRLVADSGEATGLKYVADTTNYAIAAKGDLLAGSAADTVAPLTVGTNEERLVADSAQATGLAYVADTTNYAIAAKGDLLVGTAADTVAPLTVGSNGTIPVARSAATAGLAYVNALKGRITGLDLSNSATDATNDIVVAAGACLSSDDAEWMALSAALTKRIDASWAVGDTQGGLDGTESVAGTPDNDTWYYVWLIKRSDTGVVDALFSESSTAPTMPTNYDFKRLIGVVRRDTAVNRKFYQDGDHVKWQAAQAVLSGGTATTETAITISASVPSIAKSFLAHAEVSGTHNVENTMSVLCSFFVATGVVFGRSGIQHQDASTGSLVTINYPGPKEFPNTGVFNYLLGTANTARSVTLRVSGFKLAR